MATLLDFIGNTPLVELKVINKNKNVKRLEKTKGRFTQSTLYFCYPKKLNYNFSKSIWCDIFFFKFNAKQF